MRRQPKTPQKQDSRPVDVSSAGVTLTTPTSRPATTPRTVAEVSDESPLVDISDTAALPAATAADPITDAAAAAAKPKTPQARKSRSRIAANFGALNSQS